MAARSPRDDQRPPMLHRRFTSFTSDIDLAVSTPVGSGITHLPCYIVVEAGAADVFAFKDVLGNAAQWTYAAAAVDGHRLSPAVIVGTTTDVVSVTAFWESEP
jgi:hypothetical protein